MTDTVQKLRRISRFIDDHRPLWTQRPFVDLPVPWESDWPELSSVLRRLSETELDAAEADPVGFLAVSGVAPALCAELAALATMPTLVTAAIEIPRRPAGVDDRKWRQIVHFNAAIANHLPSGVSYWVDWCSGKGHLGVALNRQLGQPVRCIEINRDLVSAGNRCMNAEHRDVAFIAANVLTDDLTPHLTEAAGVVALHACGHLNSRLFELAITVRPGFLAVVPCCYQRIDGMQFTPLSTAGKGTGLEFTRHQLRLPALDEVKTSVPRRRFRKREMAFRQGVDLLLREASGADHYTPLGKIPPAMVRGGFEAFARYAAHNAGRSLPQQVNWPDAEAAGWQRQHLVRALSISRQLFRRIIEVWLFFDRVAWLEENGYRVQYGTFCNREMTPRNLMLMATHSSSSMELPGGSG